MSDTKFCPNCGAQIISDSPFCSYCGAKQLDVSPNINQTGQTVSPSPIYQPPTSVDKQHVSSLWYLLPILFAILGGVIAWYVNRKKDPGKARNFLMLGAMMTAFLWLASL